jgi:DNA-binding HxlR family transcriptional regulator
MHGGSMDTCFEIRRVEFAYLNCLSQVVIVLAEWTIHILDVLRDRPVRLGQLRRGIPQASKKTLIGSLRSLEVAGIVLRKDKSGSVLHVEYELVEKSSGNVAALLDHLGQWSETLRPEMMDDLCGVDTISPIGKTLRARRVRCLTKEHSVLCGVCSSVHQRRAELCSAGDYPPCYLCKPRDAECLGVYVLRNCARLSLAKQGFSEKRRLRLGRSSTGAGAHLGT